MTIASVLTQTFGYEIARVSLAASSSSFDRDATTSPPRFSAFRTTAFASLRKERLRYDTRAAALTPRNRR